MTKLSFQERTLQDIECKNGYGSVDGPFGSNLPASAYTETGVPVIRGVNLSLGGERFKDYDYKFISENFSEKLKRSSCKPNDIIFTKKGTLGQTGLVPFDSKYNYFILSSNQMRVRLDEEVADPVYVYYFVSCKQSQDRILADAMTAGVPKINLTYLRKFKILLPELLVQKKIAAILSTYDDLIENNKRRITILEKMAEEIYREWFVRFRFPGYQTAEFEKGIPKTWAMVRLEKAFKFLGGGTPSKDNTAYWGDGDVNWFTPSDITGAKGVFLSESGDKPNEEGLKNCSTKLFPAYSIMMTSRATIGELGINRTEACTNQGFITCIPNKRYPLCYLFFWLKLSRNYFISLCGGATFPEINKGTFKRIEILTPPETLIEDFQRKVEPLFSQIEQLLLKNEKLEKTKNLLLPRLISGKLSVEGLDIQFPPSMLEDDAA